jgi:hypothetical protein
MKTETSYPTLIIHPRRAMAVIWASSAAIVLSVSFGGLLASLFGRGFESPMVLVYLLLLGLSIFGLRKGWRDLGHAMRPVVELNSEELIDFRTDTRIAWASMVELAQRRERGAWIIAIEYLDENDPNRLERYDLPLSGYNISGRRLGAEIRKRFAEVDAGPEVEDMENPATSP